MFDSIERLVSRAIQSFAREFWRKLSTCRECGCRANPWTWICKHCGAVNPVKIDVSPQVLFTAVACEVVLVILNVRLG